MVGGVRLAGSVKLEGRKQMALFCSSLWRGEWFLPSPSLLP